MSVGINFPILVENLLAEGEYQEALALCREGVEKFPDYSLGRVMLAKALSLSGSDDEAISEAKSIESISGFSRAARKIAKGEKLEAKTISPKVDEDQLDTSAEDTFDLQEPDLTDSDDDLLNLDSLEDSTDANNSDKADNKDESDSIDSESNPENEEDDFWNEDLWGDNQDQEDSTDEADELSTLESDNQGESNSETDIQDPIDEETTLADEPEESLDEDIDFSEETDFEKDTDTESSDDDPSEISDLSSLGIEGDDEFLNLESIDSEENNSEDNSLEDESLAYDASDLDIGEHDPLEEIPEEEDLSLLGVDEDEEIPIDDITETQESDSPSDDYDASVLDENMDEYLPDELESKEESDTNDSDSSNDTFELADPATQDASNETEISTQEDKILVPKTYHYNDVDLIPGLKPYAELQKAAEEAELIEDLEEDGFEGFSDDSEVGDTLSLESDSPDFEDSTDSDLDDEENDDLANLADELESAIESEPTSDDEDDIDSELDDLDSLESLGSLDEDDSSAPPEEDRPHSPNLSSDKITKELVNAIKGADYSVDSIKNMMDNISADDSQSYSDDDGDNQTIEMTETIAKIFWEQEAFPEAIASYKKLIEIEPENEEKFKEAIDSITKEADEKGYSLN